jgi:hypothetical protein
VESRGRSKLGVATTLSSTSGRASTFGSKASSWDSVLPFVN